MTTKHIDHAVPLIRAVVIHPDGRSESPRLAEERLEEAVGLARALDLDVRAEEIVRIRKPGAFAAAVGMDDDGPDQRDGVVDQLGGQVGVSSLGGGGADR